VCGVLDFVANLTRLDLSHNLLRTFPGELIGKLTLLQVLNLSYNGISYLPTNVIHRNLQQLDLSHNLLESLSSKSFANLSSLRSLNISYNLLTDIPESIGTCCNLRYFIASNNQFSVIPPGLLLCTGLEEINLRSNMIRGMISPRFGDSMPALRVLGLQGNACTRKGLRQLLAQNAHLSRVTKFSIDYDTYV